MTVDAQVASEATALFTANRRGLLIDGHDLQSADGRTFETIDPSTGNTVATVSWASAVDVDGAVRSATQALTGWRVVAPAARESLLHAFADLIEQHARELAELDSLENGKPVEQIVAIDIPAALATLRYYAGFPTKIYGQTIPVSTPNLHSYTRREPIGVVAAIVPWNFPLTQAIYKVAPALAAGCTVVLKPAEQTCLSGLRLGELALEAGLPAGVLNVVTGDGSTGAALVEHPGVAKVAFTGSEVVGKQIARTAAATLKHVTLELGGKNPHLIFADANLEIAARTAAAASFFYTGQVCFAGSRVMVERAAYDDVMAILVEEAAAHNPGFGLDPNSTMGPLITREHRERVESYINGAQQRGASLVHGGSQPGGELGRGFFLEPTIIGNVRDEDVTVTEEIFGPVVVVQTFDSDAEALARANSSELGLAAGVWTSNIERSHRMAANLQAGAVWVNTYSAFDAAAPWGGTKQSGYGRDGGTEGLDRFLETTTVWMGY